MSFAIISNWVGIAAKSNATSAFENFLDVSCAAAFLAILTASPTVYREPGTISHQGHQDSPWPADRMFFLISSKILRAGFHRLVKVSVVLQQLVQSPYKGEPLAGA